MTTGTDGITIRASYLSELPAVRALMVRIIEGDYGYGYDPRWHGDLDDLQGLYLDRPRQALLVAVDDTTGATVGTIAVRTLAITTPPHPAPFVARYDRARSAELVRVFVDPAYRRRGIARALVAAARRWVAGAGGYDVICLHSQFAVAFWRTLATEVFVEATGPDAGTAYLELTVPQRARP